MLHDTQDGKCMHGHMKSWIERDGFECMRSEGIDFDQ